MGHVSSSLKQVRSEQCSSVGKNDRQEGQQVQARAADALLAHLKKECHCVRRGEEERKPLKITLQIKLCCQVTLCCLVWTQLK